MDQVVTFKGFPHIGEKVLGYLTQEDDFKSGFEVCKSWNEILKNPFFWLKKLKELNQPDEDMEKWMNSALELIDFSHDDEKVTVNLRKEYFQIKNPFFWLNKLKEWNPPAKITEWMISALEIKHLSFASTVLAKSLQAEYIRFKKATRGIPNGKYLCNTCKRGFLTPTVLNCHQKIHLFERNFRCDACSVSFRTSGHLAKHKRSSGHFNQVNINAILGQPSVAINHRPFNCADCKIGLRIYGHLAKHLRSKSHILKLESTGKLPVGLYDRMEQIGTNFNAIDTSSCESSLESLKKLATNL